MPDFLKKAKRRTESACHEGESGLAALFVRPRQGDETKRLGAPGGTLAKVTPGADTTPADAAEPPTGPGSILTQNAVMVLTEQRILVFAHGSMTGRVRDLIGEIALADVSSMQLHVPPPEEKVPASLEICFVDGSTAVLTPGSRRKQFVDAYERVASELKNAGV